MYYFYREGEGVGKKQGSSEPLQPVLKLNKYGIGVEEMKKEKSHM